MTENKVLGIDLGTSTCCVSVIIDRQPKVITDRDGANIQHSVVYFRDDGKIIVGTEAKQYIIKDSANTVYSAKRLIGRKYYSSEVKRAQAICPYQIVEGPNHSVNIVIQKKTYTLQEISAFLLKKMRNIAEEALGEKIANAVITVPAYFNDNQRAATKDAGKIAGLEVLRIINEPTAAALAYGYGKDIKQRVAVYDLGGGTFDMSILELGDGVYEVISTSGDTYLGGDDFDDRIMDYCGEQFFKQHGIDVRKDKYTLQFLKEAAERAKIELSEKDSTEMFVPQMVQGPNGPLDFKMTLTRDLFINLVMDLITKTFKVCDEALQLARLSPSDVDGIILTGAPTKIPFIRKSVEAYFGKEPLKGINPEETVAIGAALHGASLSSNSQNMVLIDITPLSLGIEIAGGLVEKLIEINTPVPADNTKIFTTTVDNQESVRISVFQGEQKKAKYNELLGEFVFTGFKKAARGDVKIAVTFEIDTNGILNVSAKDPETGKAQSVQFQASGRMEERKINELQKATEGVVC